MRWKSILAMLLALGLLCLTAGCKQTEQQQGQTQATPDASTQTVLQQNPLLAELVAFSEAKDIAAGKMAERLENYTKQEGQPDYTALIQAVQSPFVEGDAQLFDLLSNLLDTKQSAEQIWSVENEQQTGRLVLSEGQYRFDGTIVQNTETNAVQVQQVTMAQDGSSVDASLSTQQADGTGAVLQLWMQYQHTGQQYRVQYYYTTDDGESYQVLRSAFDDTQFSFAMYNEVEQRPASLFTLSDDSLYADGWVTKVTFDGQTVHIENDGKSLTI